MTVMAPYGRMRWEK